MMLCAASALSAEQLLRGRAAASAGRHSASPGGSAHAWLADSNAPGTWHKWAYLAGRGSAQCAHEHKPRAQRTGGRARPAYDAVRGNTARSS